MLDPFVRGATTPVSSIIQIDVSLTDTSDPIQYAIVVLLCGCIIEASILLPKESGINRHTMSFMHYNSTW